jgi:molybdopterin-binding protein
MNKIQKAGLIVAMASGMSFAAGSIWSASANYGITHFPWVRECLYGPNSTFDETDSDDPCFKLQGGWWFGYVFGPGAGDQEPRCGYPAAKSGTNTVFAKIDGESANFVGPDYSSCEGPDLTDRATGASKLDDGYLEVQLTVGSGAKATYDPDGAGIGVNFSSTGLMGDPPPTEIDVSNYQGFCMTYESDHPESSADLEFGLELGWDEVAEDDNAWDTWIYVIPSGDGVQVKNFTWRGTQENADRYTPNTIGDFKQDNFDAAPRTMDWATKHMKAVKIRLKGYEAAVVNFKLIQFGWFGECNSEINPDIPIGVVTPIISKIAVANSLSLHNKMLSINNVKSPAAVQILNLQGAVVHSQVYVPENRMNLGNLPTGVYMVRIPSQGYSGKIMLK